MIRFGFSKGLDQFAQLTRMLTSPLVEEKRRFKITLNQMLQNQAITWRFAHRIMQFADSTNMQIEVPNLIQRLKENKVEVDKQKQIVEVMRRHFNDDEVYFTEVFRALIKEEDLEFHTASMMLEVYLDHSECFIQSELATLSQIVIATCEDAEIYDLFHFLPLYEKSEQLQSVLQVVEERIIETLPNCNGKYLKQLLRSLRNGNVSVQMQETLLQYFDTNWKSMGRATIMEFLHLVSSKKMDNEQFKIKVLKALNLQAISDVNLSQLQDHYRVPNLPMQESEMIANLITLSGYQVDLNYYNDYNKESHSKRRELLAQLESNQPEIKQIVEEVHQYINGNQQFATLFKVFRIVQKLQLTIPELLTTLSNCLDSILQSYKVNTPQLLEMMFYYDSKSVQLELSKESVGYQQLMQDVIQHVTPHNTQFLIMQYAFSTVDLPEYREVIEKSLGQCTLPLNILADYYIIISSHKLPISNALQQAILTALKLYETKSNQYDYQHLYKMVSRMNIQSLLTPTQLEIYKKGEQFTKYNSTHQTKSTKDTASHLEQQIFNDLVAYLPSEYRVQQNILHRGVEVDFVIETPKSSLYLQIHGATHFYRNTKCYNYSTVVINRLLGMENNFVCISHNEMASIWYPNRKSAVLNLIKCLH